MRHRILSNLIASVVGAAVLGTPVLASGIGAISLDQMSAGIRTLTAQAPDFNTNPATAQSCIWSINGANKGTLTETGPNTGVFTSQATMITPGENIARVTCFDAGGQPIFKEYTWTTSVVTTSVAIGKEITFSQNANTRNDNHFYAQISAPAYNLDANYREHFCKLTLTDTTSGYISPSFVMEETAQDSGVFKTDQITADYGTYRVNVTCTDYNGNTGSTEQIYSIGRVDTEGPTIGKIMADTYEPGARDLTFTANDAQSAMHGCWLKVDNTSYKDPIASVGNTYTAYDVPMEADNHVVTVRCLDKAGKPNWSERSQNFSLAVAQLTPPNENEIVVTSQGTITRLLPNGVVVMTVNRVSPFTAEANVTKNLPKKGKLFTVKLAPAAITNHVGLYAVGDKLTLTTVVADPNDPTSAMVHTAENLTMTSKNVMVGTASSFSIPRSEFSLTGDAGETTVGYTARTALKQIDAIGNAVTVASGNLDIKKSIVVRGTLNRKVFKATAILLYDK